jgi:uncharacterized protein
MSMLPVLNPPVEAVPAAPGPYRSSAYNVFVERGKVVWACNTRSGAFARLTREQYRSVEGFLAGQRPETDDTDTASLYHGLVRGQFLIPADLVEMEMLKVRNHLTRFSARGMGMVIAPTLRCNFKCPYCYVDRNANKMSADARERVKRFFDRRLNEKTKASVCWTGGDPSLALDAVSELSESFIRSCEEKESTYDAVMITNGYLLDRAMLDVVQRSQIQALQITFDGGRDFHDRTRCLAGGRPTYDRIMDNVAAAHEEVEINVRINVDGRNRRSVDSVLGDLVARGLGGTQVGVYFAHVQAMNAQGEAHKDECLSTEEYARLEPQLIARALSLGLQHCGNPLRRQLGSFCGANSNNHFVIDSKARLQKCYDDLGHADTQGIGYIDEDGGEVIDKQTNLLHWISWDPFEFAECRSCKVLPMCMGGCSYHVIRNKSGIGPGCLKLRFNLEQIIELYGERLSNGSPGDFVSGPCGSGGCSGN